MTPEEKAELKSRRARTRFDYVYRDSGGWDAVIRRLEAGETFTAIAPDYNVTPENLGKTYKIIMRRNYKWAPRVSVEEDQ